ncbi:hypothetical protein LguiA_029981 [Lonicera macranthoides]
MAPLHCAEILKGYGIYKEREKDIEHSKQLLQEEEGIARRGGRPPYPRGEKNKLARGIVSRERGGLGLNLYKYKVEYGIKDDNGGLGWWGRGWGLKVEELQARVTALEVRLGGGSSCVDPLCSFAPSGGSSRFPSLAENNVPNVIPTAMDLSEPIPGSFLRLLMSEEGVQNILSTSTNLVENGAPLTEVDLPSFPNRSYDQATLDAVYQGASEGFLSQSSLDDFVADFTEPTGLDWTASGNTHHDFFDSSSSDLSTVLNFDADDFQILQPFLND